MTEKLQDKFTGTGEVKGFAFEKVYEDENSYIYKVENSRYECFFKKTVAKCIDFKNRIYSETEFKEVYPKSRDFGNWAWSAFSLEEAKLKLTR